MLLVFVINAHVHILQGPQGPQGRVGEVGPKGPNVSDPRLHLI